MPSKPPHADLAAGLLSSLRDLHLLHPGLPPEALAGVLQELIVFGHKHNLLAPSPATLTPKKKTAAGELLQHALEAALDAVVDDAAAATGAKPGDDRTPTELLYKHHALHVDRAGSYYSFPAPFKRKHSGAARG